MNWLLKVAIPLKTENLPQSLAKAIEYECGGAWEAGQAKNWTADLDAITGKQLGQDVGYSTSFWISCKIGDGYFHQKWGVSVNFTVTSGSSNTIFDSETGDWDLSIDVSVQWASPKSWTPESPYPLLIKSVGERSDMKTIQEVANFVKQSIWDDQRDEGDDDPDMPEVDPDPSLSRAPVLQPTLV